MKRILIATAIVLTAFQATAGSVTYEPPAVVAIESPERMGGSGAWIIPLVILAVVALAVLTEEEEEAAISDSRLKADIDRVGMAANGLPLYSFRYIGQTQVHTGVMAQDVLAHTPEAIIMLPGGYMAVNYGMLGLSMEAVN